MLSGVERRRLALPERGVEIALLDWGGARPLALLHHANGFCAAVWEPVARRLRHRFRVVAMDARGHGDSSKPEGPEAYAWREFGADLRAVVEALAAEQPDGRIGLGLGHSFGGTSILLASAERPDLFARNVLVDPILAPSGRARGSLRDRKDRREGGKTLVERARNRRAVWNSRAEARESYSGKPLFADWEPGSLDLYLAEGMRDLSDGRVALKCPPEVEATIFAGSQGEEVWSQVGRSSPPTLVLWARRGDFERAHFEELARRLPDGRVHDADAGHLVVMEDPALVAREALAFAGVQDSTG